MFRYHTAEEIRRYDLMKLGVLVLLILLLMLTWIATRDSAPLLGVGEQTEGTPVAGDAGIEDADATLPVPTLAVPAINLPAEPLQPGTVNLSGTAGPGAQVVVLVNGTPSGTAIAGVNGDWSALVDLPAGSYTLQVQTVDNVGGVAGESQPVAITVGETAPVETVTLNPPGFDALSGAYLFTGSVAPGQTVNIVVNGAVVGSASADESGNFVVEVPADAVAGDVQLQATDATGAVTQQSDPMKLNSRPPSLSPSADVQVEPNSGAVVLPSRPEGLLLSGRGEPGTQVQLQVNGAPGGSAMVDATGAWSLPLALPDGIYTLQFNTLDPGGSLLSSATPLTVAVGEVAAGTVAASTPAAEATAPAAEAATAVPAEGSDQTLADVLTGRPEFSTLVSVLQSTGSLAILAEAGPFTTFAPTNEAFADLPQRVIDGLNANPQVLSQLLQYHITRGLYPAADLLTVQPATVNGRLLTISSVNGALNVNDAVVTTPDIGAANGVIHAIDRILVPPLAEGVRPPVIDASGVPTFAGTFLTIVGTAEPNRTILVELNGEPFGDPAVVGPDTRWAVSGNVTPGEYQIVAYMLGAADALEAISRPVTLLVSSQ